MSIAVKMTRSLKNLPVAAVFGFLVWTILLCGSMLITSSSLWAQATTFKASPATSGERSKSPKTWLIAIGIDNYTHDWWIDLRFPTSDVRKLEAKLRSSTSHEMISTLILAGKATLPHIRAALNDVATKAHPHDLVIIYFSAHGTLVPTKNAELEQTIVLQNSTPDDIRSTGLGHAELRRMMDRISARKKVLILATCHSGVGKSRLTPEAQELVASQKGTTLSEVSEGALIFAAAAKGETAREDAKLGGDIYTHWFIEGLGVNDRNRDGAISALEAHDYARDRTWKWTNGKQRPTIESKMIGDGDPILAGKPNTRGLPVIDAYETAFENFALEINDGVKGTIPSGFALRQGHNVVRIFSPESQQPLAAWKVQAQKGERLSLSELIAPPPWLLTVSATQARLQDDRVKRLIGNAQTSEFAAGIHRRVKRYSLGVAISRLGSKSGTAAPQVQGSIEDRRAHLIGAWSHPVTWDFELFIRFGIGWGTASLDLKDDDAGSTASVEGQGLSATGSIGATLQTKVLHTTLTPVMHWTDSRSTVTDATWWPGPLNASRLGFGIEIGLPLGGTSRRL